MQAVPNFSEGRDPVVVKAIVDAMRVAGAAILDWSSDADHHRCVVTMVGPPHVVEDAAVAGARVAMRYIDLRYHDGVHPRVGALDVLPFVPLVGVSMDEARASARRTGRRLAAELGLPVYFYGQASDPPGRTLAELRRGGFEALRTGWPTARTPDVLPGRWVHPGAHPTAGVTCVGARSVLLAWNVHVAGITIDAARHIAASIREAGGGFTGVRALAFLLPGSGRLQISMNLEDVEATAPMSVFARIEDLVAQYGGVIEETEIIGMLPDQLVWGAAADRLRLSADTASRMLSPALVAVLASGTTPSQDE
jgi:glutamate formiminotransferase / 5-formyltetrahydrofolate cyclo-ligase